MRGWFYFKFITASCDPVTEGLACTVDLHTRPARRDAEDALVRIIFLNALLTFMTVDSDHQANTWTPESNHPKCQSAPVGTGRRGHL